MPKLIIDNREIEVPEGIKVIEAADRAGIYIPRFCYYAELGAVGACRICAVKFVDGPVKGIEMSCMINAQDGMVVSTTDPEARDFRRHVIEWLMMNHPHDCPVCDEGGHCLLQDLTESCDHGIRRYKGKKRTYVDQYLGPLIQHEENRCIQCYRCSRYYQEFAGYKDLGVMGIAQRIYFGRYAAGVLESPFSGNIIDLCPTGVYTDKPSRYTGRRWDYERVPGICINCSLGCHITVSARYREIVYLEGRYSGKVNGSFICDRGRYGFFYANLEERPRQGRVRGEDVPSGRAITMAAQRVKEVSESHGAAAIAVIGSGRSSLETIAALTHVCKVQGWRGPVLFDSRVSSESVRTAVSCIAQELAVSMKEIESADFILTVGADPINEAPMLAMAMRQAWRKGAGVAAIDCRSLDWPFQFEQVTAAPDDMADFLAALENSETTVISDRFVAQIKSIAAKIRACHRPVVVCGTEITDSKIIYGAAGFVKAMRQAGQEAGLFYTLPAANSYGAALLDEIGETAEDLIERIESGEIKALVIVESDLWDTFSDRQRLIQALEQLELLVVADFMATEILHRADIIIPTLSIFEAGGIYVNQEGRAQWSPPAYAGGTPIKITGQGGHPPRIIRPDIPAGDISPAWRMAWWLADRQPPASHDLLLDWMGKTFPVLEKAANFTSEGIRLYLPEARRKTARETGGRKIQSLGEYLLLPVAAVFGDEPMAQRSPCLEGYAKHPEMWMAASDARLFDASDGDAARLQLPYGPLELTLRLSERIAPGTLIVYRCPDLFWQQFARSSRFIVPKDRIRIEKKA